MTELLWMLALLGMGGDGRAKTDPAAAKAREEHERAQLARLAVENKCATCYGLGHLPKATPHGLLDGPSCLACNGTGNLNKQGTTWQVKEAASDRQESDAKELQHHAWAAEHNRQYFESKAN